MQRERLALRFIESTYTSIVSRSRPTIVVVLLALSVSLSLAPPHAAADTAQLLQRAQEALSSKRYSVAVELYLRLWAETRDSGALFNIAIIKYRQRALRESEEYLNRYIEASGVSSDDARVIALRDRIKRAQETLSASPSTATLTAQDNVMSAQDNVPSAQDNGDVTPQTTSSIPPQTPTGSGDDVQGAPSASQQLTSGMKTPSMSTSLPSHQSWVTPTLYSVGAVSALSALGLYAYAHHVWDKSEGGEYLKRFEARRSAETFTWVGDGLMLSGIVILVYTALRPNTDVSDVSDMSAYQLRVHRDALTLNVTF